MKRRFLSMLLAVCMVLTLLPSAVLAAEDKGLVAAPTWADGMIGATDTWDNGGIISTAEELAQFAYNINNGKKDYADQTITLANDIDLSGKRWVPIGTDPDADGNGFTFEGTFDGQNHTISGLNYAPDQPRTGLFTIVGATIKNLTVAGEVNVTAVRDPEDKFTGYAAGIAALAMNSSFINCHNKVNITLDYDLTGKGNTVNTVVGGIVGLAGGDVTIDGCSNSAVISGSKRCDADQQDTDVQVGGIIGSVSWKDTSATITNCYNTGALAAHESGGTDSYVALGGIVGLGGLDSTIANCYNTGTLNATDDIEQKEVYFGGAGGIAGFAHDRSHYANCYSTGSITGTGLSGTSGTTNVGGIAGITFDTTVSSCYYLGTGTANGIGCVLPDCTPTFEGCGVIGTDKATLTAGTTAQFGGGSEQSLAYGESLLTALNGWVTVQTTPDNYKQWEVKSGANSGYPVLKGQEVPAPPHSHCVCGGTEKLPDHTSHSNITYTAIGAAFAGGNLEGNIYLGQDVTTTSTLTVEAGKTLNLCLNGHRLFAGVEENGKFVSNGAFPVITVEGGGTLNLCNCQNRSFPDNGRVIGGVCGIASSGTVNMYGGTIIGNGAYHKDTVQIAEGNNGGGVRVNGGTFTLYGGDISQNLAYHGGGVYVARGATFEIQGGLVTNEYGAYYVPVLSRNAADGNGGGVYVAKGGSFTMNGGALYSNQATQEGGGIYAGDEISLGGAVRINANVLGTEDRPNNNLFLTQGKTITVLDALECEAPIGVTTESMPTNDKAVTITTASSGDHSALFTGDDTAYRGVNSGEGNAQVVQLIPRDPFVENTTQNKRYTSLQKAFHEAAGGDTITLLEDYNNGTNTVNLSTDKAVTFDLNGKTLAGLTTVIAVGGGVSLTVTDSTPSGAGVLSASGASPVSFSGAGTLTLAGGTLNLGGVLYLLHSDSTLNLQGGTIRLAAGVDASILNYNGTVRISGGSIEGYASPDQENALDYVAVSNHSSFSMSGGSISVKMGLAIYTGGGTVTITGGSISSEGYAAINSQGSSVIHISQADAAVPTVISSSGGPVDVMPSAAILIIPEGAGSKRVLWVEGGTIQNTYTGSEPSYAVYMSKTTLWNGKPLPATDLGVMTLSPAATYMGAIRRGNEENSSSSDSGSTPTIKPTAPVTGSTEIKAAVDDKGNASTTITDKNIMDAIASAKAEAKKKGVSPGDITAVIRVETPADSSPNTVSVSLPKTVQEKVIGDNLAEIKLVIDRPGLTIGINLAVVAEFNKQAGADVQLSVTGTDASKLGTAAHDAIGSRPAFDLKVTYASGAKSITDFGGGSVSVEIPYVLQAGETADNVRAVYVGESGAVQYLFDSRYDAECQTLVFGTNHFSVYGVGYKAACNFTDIDENWAKDDILFVANRGLLTGTGATTFTPEGGMTRGMFVTALWRLAGTPQAGESAAFTDVPLTAYYADAVTWANKNNIAVGAGDGKFAPDTLITREQMAVIMQRYTTAIGFRLPQTHAQNTFADSAKMSDYAADAVKAMQMAGVLVGKNGNLFAPQETATRAEAAAVLRRFVELV